MPPNHPLSYPTLKCVLEYLEAVKRLHITARSPGLQKIEKLIPLRLEHLCFECNNTFEINKLLIKIKWCGENVCLMMNGIDRGVIPEEAIKVMKKLIFNLFGGRSNLHVNKLDYDINYIPKYLTSAADLKLRVNFLNPTDHQCFEAVLPLLRPDSFPLKTFITTVTGPVIHEHPVIKSAETLILLIDPSHTTIEMDDIKKLSNKTLIVDSCYNGTLRFHTFGLVKYLKTGQKPIGTTYIFSACKGNVKNLLFIMEMAFKNFKNPLNDVQERFIADAPRFSIPINTDSRIIAFGRDRAYVKEQWSLVVKVVPASVD